MNKTYKVTLYDDGKHPTYISSAILPSGAKIMVNTSNYSRSGKVFYIDQELNDKIALHLLYENLYYNITETELKSRDKISELETKIEELKKKLEDKQYDR